MKKFITNKITVIVLVSILILSFIGVGIYFIVRNAKKDNSTLTIYTSFYPLYDFTSRVVGNKATIINLVKAGEDVHHYEPDTKQRAGMEDADLIIINGLEMEEWVSKLDSQMQEKIVDTSAGISLIKKTDNINPTNYQTATASDTDLDKHIWLSIKNAKKQMENIKNALIEKDPQNADYYQTNYDIHAYQFDLLDNAYTQELSGVTRNEFMVSHPAFRYLAKDYGLAQYYFEGIDENGEPDGATLAQNVNKIVDENITVIFYQELQSKSVAETLAREAGLRGVTVTIKGLNTIAGLSEDEIDSGYDYLTKMTENLLNLKSALV